MAYPKLAARSLLVAVLGCVGCDAAGHESEAESAKQNVLIGEDAGYLIPIPIPDAGVGTSLTTRVPAKTDAAALAQGDAGQGDAAQGDAGDGDAGQTDAGDDDAQGDAGPVATLRGDVNPPEELPDCNAVYFRDLDGDGYGDDGVKLTSCAQPAGYVDVGGDCYDNNDRAHPNATGQFLQQRGDGSFDYDCDGVETKLHTDFAVCPDLGDKCNSAACDADALQAASDTAENGGWTNLPVLGIIPACGQPGPWGLSVSWYPGLAQPLCAAPADGTTRVQTCR